MLLWLERPRSGYYILMDPGSKPIALYCLLIHHAGIVFLLRSNCARSIFHAPGVFRGRVVMGGRNRLCISKWGFSPSSR